MRRGFFDTRGGQVIRHAFKPPAIDHLDPHSNTVTEGDIDEYMNTTFVNELREVFKKAGFAQSENGQDIAHSWMLVGVRGRLYHVDADYCVLEDRRTYAAIGSGGQVACGAMGALEGSDLDAEARIRRALAMAEEHCSTVRGPFTVLCSKKEG